MDNLKSPASPTNLYNSVGGANGYAHGFTKLELASLMIAQGIVANPQGDVLSYAGVAEAAVKVAKAVLEEANK